MKNVLTFGEPLMINYIISKNKFGFSESYFSLGGSEINTAVTLTNLENKVYLISMLPNNELGNDYLETIQNLGIDTRFVLKSNENLLGSMYVKDNHVIYQRQHSAFSSISESSLDWDNVFSIDYNWVHLSGITPVLSNNCKNMWIKMLNKSLELKLPVSIDLNYRPALGEFSYLWGIMKPYIHLIDTFIISKSDIQSICELEYINSDKNIHHLLNEISNKLKINRLVICIKTDDFKSQNRNSIMVYRNKLYESKVKNHTPIENIGGGDSYVGCLIDLLLENKQSINDILDHSDFYTILSQEEKGNFSSITKKQFLNL